MKWDILKTFSGNNTLGFTFQDVSTEYPKKNRVYLAMILADMVDNGILYKIDRGIYHIIPLQANPESYVPDGYQVAKYVMQNKEYYLGYGSAMKIHGLSLQSEPREFIVTKKQMKPSIKNFGGITIQFIQHGASRFFGENSMWINQNEQAMVSDLEKTIVDISSKPQLSGGIVEVGNAIFKAKDRLILEKLFYYFARNGNKSAKKRFLFLTDLLGLDWTSDHDRMMEELGSGVSLLDPSKPDHGQIKKKFGLKINVDTNHIIRKILRQ